MNRWNKLAGAFFTLSAASLANALEADLSLGYTGNYSTNITQAVADEIEGWTHTPNAELSISEDIDRLFLQIDYEIQERYFDDSRIEDEGEVLGRAQLNWGVVQNVWSINASNVRSESTIDTQDGRRDPNNRQTTDLTSIGTTVRIPSFGRQFFNVSYDYSETSPELTFNDDQRDTYTVEYNVPLSENRRWYLEATRQDVDYEEALIPDFEVTRTGVGYVQENRRLLVDFFLGRQKYDRELSRSNISDTTTLLDVTYDFDNENRINLSYSEAIEDSAAENLAGIPVLGTQLIENSDTGEIFVDKRTSISVTTRVGDNQISIEVFDNEQDFEDITRDEENTGVYVSWTRAVLPSVQMKLSALFNEQEFPQDGRKDDEIDVVLEFDWENNSRWDFKVLFGYADSSSNFDGEDFDEYFGQFEISYDVL